MIKRLPTEELQLRAVHLQNLIGKCRDKNQAADPMLELTRIQEELNRRIIKDLAYQKLKKPTTIFIGGKR